MVQLAEYLLKTYRSAAMSWVAKGRIDSARSQVRDDVHTRPHDPQFASSFPRFRHTPSQFVWFPWQVSTQAPAMHCWPVGQALPQALGSKTSRKCRKPLRSASSRKSLYAWSVT